jgi:myo-inositol-1(or 4)-monophosphatase
VAVLDTLRELLSVGGAELLARRSTTRTIERKRSQADLVTDADTASEARILERLQAIAPYDGHLSEESGFIPGTTGRTWIIDPLDGTTNFVAGLDDFGVIIGVLDQHSRPVAGGMYLPAHDLLYLAEAGHGATRNGERIYASSTAAVEDAVFDHSLAYLPQTIEDQERTLAILVRRARAVRCNQSLRYLAYVAEGTYDGFVYHTCGLWDLAGPSVILAEAGASISAIDGAPLDLNLNAASAARIYQAVGANPKLHSCLMDLLR